MSIIYNTYIRYIGRMVCSESIGSLPQVDLDSSSISYTYPRDIETMVYRTSTTLILNDMNTEETRVLLLDSPTSSRSLPPSPFFRDELSNLPSYTPYESRYSSNQQSRGASSSCSIGDPNEELNTSGSPLPITSEPLNFHISTIYVPKARLNELEELERNLSTIVGNGLIEYIYNENMTHTEESLQTSPHESGDDTET